MCGFCVGVPLKSSHAVGSRFSHHFFSLPLSLFTVNPGLSKMCIFIFVDWWSQSGCSDYMCFYFYWEKNNHGQRLWGMLSVFIRTGTVFAVFNESKMSSIHERMRFLLKSSAKHSVMEAALLYNHHDSNTDILFCQTQWLTWFCVCVVFGMCVNICI